jgi:Mn-dependent DtxR family transcriptional regulator
MAHSANLQDNLDNLYFYLPIMRGEMRQVAGELGVCRYTVCKWLRRLQAEGLAKRVWNGWLKCYDWSEDNGDKA